MAFRHAVTIDDVRAGMWERTGRVNMYTAKAVLFADAVTGKSVWLPRAKIVVDDARDDQVTVCLPDWLARKVGLIA